MGFLKGLATFILGFIFFIALTVFSVAFMLHGTLFSDDFVTNQVDKMPISSIARDLGDEVVIADLPQNMTFVKDVALNVIEKQEPLIKKELKAAINTGYDYFMGETDYLSITVPLIELKQNISDTIWDEAKAYLNEQLAGKSDAEISSYLQDIIRQIPENFLPSDLYTLPPDERDKYIEQYLRYLAGVPQKTGADYPALDSHYKSLGDQYINQYLNDFINDLPSTYTIDESSINSDTMHALQNARLGIGYFQTYYYWLIVLMVVLAVLIFLVNWSVKAPARSLGIDLIIIGVVDLVGIILVRTLPVMQWAEDIFKVDISASLNSWIEGLINDVTGVALPLTIGILVVGVILLVVSIVVPGKKKEVLP